ncbi:hypothetical protein J2Y45_004348 [Dyadobacter sp. BE34]|uniref:Uncharacterized protein n=1 Tax=Dyadobacter fermentans TaxID=94254 RepID=A0ABU1R1N3_9BACT|nr:hypothetical protein [Dyadobacter fermentans]MDR7045059.1 hypothetical protein [Dyadobacter sp. BE242]MDR7199205.1 hypothetical protein [Dyadobacter sp. BE34]MDR7217165.1 hypothetical protein [Dyadobacter sp. BE31]MDR7265098.1 hypothetical protein [Dyadobacter sp. BE32]
MTVSVLLFWLVMVLKSIDNSLFGVFLKKQALFGGLLKTLVIV